jgi:hypothetical protein
MSEPTLLIPKEYRQTQEPAYDQFAKVYITPYRNSEGKYMFKVEDELGGQPYVLHPMDKRIIKAFIRVFNDTLFNEGDRA